MALFYITGAPGSGKTTLQEELGKKGFDARDLDNSNLGGPHNKSTGKRVTIPPAEKRTPQWFSEHEWRIYLDAFRRLKAETAEKDIVLCGVAAADGEVLHLFDKILYLQLDDETLRRRLTSRVGNDYGKNDFELEEIIGRKHGLDLKYSSLDVITINASGALDDTLKQIALHLKT